jgi:hypothetical protein
LRSPAARSVAQPRLPDQVAGGTRPIAYLYVKPVFRSQPRSSLQGPARRKPQPGPPGSSLRRWELFRDPPRSPAVDLAAVPRVVDRSTRWGWTGVPPRGLSLRRNQRDPWKSP